MASDLLGVKPISKTWSEVISKTSAADLPISIASSSTKIPSCPEPKPNSSSAQIIPKLSSPLILPFLILKLFPSLSYNVVPIVATGTF